MAILPTGDILTVSYLLILRPKELITRKINLVFNYRRFASLEIDLEHINQGRNRMRITKFTVEDVISIATELINNEVLLMSGKSQFGKEQCTYFVKKDFYKNKIYKISFCICSDRPTTLGIITLFRAGKTNESLQR